VVVVFVFIDFVGHESTCKKAAGYAEQPPSYFP
jgi:hypothetical protein